jgi:hypothetical protein
MNLSTEPRIPHTPAYQICVEILLSQPGYNLLL